MGRGCVSLLARKAERLANEFREAWNRGTLLFDALTGPIASTLVWGIPFPEALIGQIPFTLKHLLGMAAISFIAAPLLFPSVRRALSEKKWVALKPLASQG